MSSASRISFPAGSRNPRRTLSGILEETFPEEALALESGKWLGGLFAQGKMKPVTEPSGLKTPQADIGRTPTTEPSGLKTPQADIGRTPTTDIEDLGSPSSVPMGMTTPLHPPNRRDLQSLRPKFLGDPKISTETQMAPGAMARSLEVASYTSEAVFAQERERLFGRSWLFVTSAGRLATPGNYATLDLLGHHIVVIRQTDLTLRAFVNACRHRSSLLLSPTENRMPSAGNQMPLAGNQTPLAGNQTPLACITCPYHAWTYELNGELRKAPSFDTLPNFCRSDHSLLPVTVRDCGGLIFVHPMGREPVVESPGCLALATVLSKYPFDNYRYHSQREFTIECNWKTWIENYQECYHCRVLHPLFHRSYDLSQYQIANVGALPMAEESNSFPGGMWFSHHRCPPKEVEEGKRTVLGGSSGEWLWIWPNLCLALYEHYYDTLQVHPVSPTRTQLTVTFYGRRDLSGEKLTEIISEASFATFQEDIAACERVTKGLEALSHHSLGVVPGPPEGDVGPKVETDRGVGPADGSLAGPADGSLAGPLHPEREAGVIFFDDLVREFLGSGH